MGLSQAVPSVPAQRAVAVLAGVSQYDLSGTGTTPFGPYASTCRWRGP